MNIETHRKIIKLSNGMHATLSGCDGHRTRWIVSAPGCGIVDIVWLDSQPPSHDELLNAVIKKRKNMDTLSKIIAYEQGDLSEEETIELFQELIHSGLAWQLQGHYGRTAARLIAAGLCVSDPSSEE